MNSQDDEQSLSSESLENYLPGVLYHYTSIEGFKGIIDKKCMRMTKYDQLNDTSEIILARDLIISIIKEYECDPENMVFKEYLLKALEYFENLNIFITSYSEKANDLEQWRAYAPKGGVAIGFDSNELARGFIDEILPDGEYKKERGVVFTPNGGGQGVRHQANFHKCLYVSGEAEERVKRSVAKWFKSEAYAGLFNLSTKEQADWTKFATAVCQMTLSKSIYDLVTTIKHNAYKNEAEWRWVNRPKPESFTKRLDEKNREYVTGGIHPEDCIKEVWISPHGDKDTIKRVLNFYQEVHNLKFSIEESDIPYRG